MATVSELEENGRGKGVRSGGIGWRAKQVVAERHVGTDGTVMGVGMILEWEDCSWTWSPPDTGGQDIGGPSNERRDHT